MASKNDKTQIKVTTGTQDSTTVRSREPQSLPLRETYLDSVFDKVVTVGEAKVKLEAELKEFRAILQKTIKPLGGEYIRNGMKATVIAEVSKPNGRLVPLAEVLKVVPKRYHSLILEDKFIKEQLRMTAIKENKVKVTIE